MKQVRVWTYIQTKKVQLLKWKWTKHDTEQITILAHCKAPASSCQCRVWTLYLFISSRSEGKAAPVWITFTGSTSSHRGSETLPCTDVGGRVDFPLRSSTVWCNTLCSLAAFLLKHGRSCVHRKHQLTWLENNSSIVSIHSQHKQ